MPAASNTDVTRLPRQQHLVDDRAKAGEELLVHEMRLARAAADAHVAAPAQHPPALRHDGLHIGKVVQHHRHEHHVRRAVGERQRFAGRLQERDAVGGGALTRLVEHLLRGIDGREARSEAVGQRLREPSGAAPEVDDVRRVGRDIWGEQAEPLLQPLQAQPSRRVVDAGDIRFVVIHRSLHSCARQPLDA